MRRGYPVAYKMVKSSSCYSIDAFYSDGSYGIILSGLTKLRAKRFFRRNTGKRIVATRKYMWGGRRTS